MKQLRHQTLLGRTLTVDEPNRLTIGVGNILLARTRNRTVFSHNEFPALVMSRSNLWLPEVEIRLVISSKSAPSLIVGGQITHCDVPVIHQVLQRSNRVSRWVARRVLVSVLRV
jgi:hypothetical protein